MEGRASCLQEEDIGSGRVEVARSLDSHQSGSFNCMAVGYHFMEEMAFYLTSNPRIEKQLYKVVLYLSISLYSLVASNPNPGRLFVKKKM